MLTADLCPRDKEVIKRRAWEIEDSYNRRFNQLWSDLIDSKVKFMFLTKNGRAFSFKGQGWKDN